MTVFEAECVSTRIKASRQFPDPAHPYFEPPVRLWVKFGGRWIRRHAQSFGLVGRIRTFTLEEAGLVSYRDVFVHQPAEPAK